MVMVAGERDRAWGLALPKTLCWDLLLSGWVGAAPENITEKQFALHNRLRLSWPDSYEVSGGQGWLARMALSIW